MESRPQALNLGIHPEKFHLCSVIICYITKLAGKH